METEALRSCKLFWGLPPREVDEKISSVPHKLVRYQRNDVVFRLGERVDRIAIVLSGNAGARKTSETGARVRVEPLSAVVLDATHPSELP